jgi:hypothetical protein
MSGTLEEEIMNQFWRFGSAAVVAAGALLGAANAQAAAIDNPCPSGGGTVCQFRFYQDTDVPFLSFSSGEFASDLWPNLSYFGSYVDGSGNMTFHDTDMQLVQTSVGLGGGDVFVRLNFTSVTGTTVLSGANPDITWTMEATASFYDASDGITEANCVTSSFEIDFSGVSWNVGVSSSFTIPSVTGCNGHSALVNANFGLGTTGATLTLYKFEGYNGSTALHGS